MIIYVGIGNEACELKVDGFLGGRGTPEMSLRECEPA
jgi:hypothetical protein